MVGYHVFYKSKEDSKWEGINYLVQIASILFWKKYFGQCNLYCNRKFLKSIKKWGIDKLYDNINTECLENIPDIGNLKCNITGLPKYWSFPKILAIKDISKYNNEFVVFDTDLWIEKNIHFNSDYDFIGYHKEQVDDHINNPYIEPSNFLDEVSLNLFDWSQSPINCAILYFNNKELIDEWYTWCLKVIDLNKDKENTRATSVDTIFIEQRLLPTIAKRLNLKIDTIIPNIYIPQNKRNGEEWNPPCGYTEDNKILTKSIKHVWGIKALFDNIKVRRLILDNLSNSLFKEFPEVKIKFNKLIKHTLDTCYMS